MRMSDGTYHFEDSPLAWVQLGVKLSRLMVDLIPTEDLDRVLGGLETAVRQVKERGDEEQAARDQALDGMEDEVMELAFKLHEAMKKVEVEGPSA